jgi:hypothetical protein
MNLAQPLSIGCNYNSEVSDRYYLRDNHYMSQIQHSDSPTKLDRLADIYESNGNAKAANCLRAHASQLQATGVTQVIPKPCRKGCVQSAGGIHYLRSITIGAVICCVALVLAPDTALRNTLIKPIEPFLGALGLWQAWNVFAPEVRKENFHLTAEITFADGTIEIWQFPRQEQLHGLTKARAERFRKWANGHIPYQAYSFMLGDTARYIAQLHKDREPKTIAITYHSAQIPPFAQMDAALPAHSEHRVLFTYAVQPEDLH